MKLMRPLAGLAVFSIVDLASFAAIAADPSVSASLLPPVNESTSVQGWQMLTIIGYLAALSMLSYVGVRWWKTRQGGMPAIATRARQITVLETRRVTPAVTLVVAEVRGAPYLIACSGTGVSIQALPESGA